MDLAWLWFAKDNFYFFAAFIEIVFAAQVKLSKFFLTIDITLMFLANDGRELRYA